jgi:hypothetical protein
MGVDLLVRHFLTFKGDYSAVVRTTAGYHKLRVRVYRDEVGYVANMRVCGALSDELLLTHVRGRDGVVRLTVHLSNTSIKVLRDTLNRILESFREYYWIDEPIEYYVRDTSCRNIGVLRVGAREFTNYIMCNRPIAVPVGSGVVVEVEEGSMIVPMDRDVDMMVDMGAEIVEEYCTLVREVETDDEVYRLSRVVGELDYFIRVCTDRRVGRECERFVYVCTPYWSKARLASMVDDAKYALERLREKLAYAKLAE